MNELKLKENLRAAQKNYLCRAFDADFKRKQRGITLEILMTCELLLSPVKQIQKYASN